MACILEYILGMCLKLTVIASDSSLIMPVQFFFILVAIVTHAAGEPRCITVAGLCMVCFYVAFQFKVVEKNMITECTRGRPGDPVFDFKVIVEIFVTWESSFTQSTRIEC